MKKAYLILSNNAVFEGYKIGADTECIGEVVFATGMVGYLETLTDPSYAGQIIVQTFPLIGNYGVIPDDFEGECVAKGYVVRDICDHPSNFRSQDKLDNFLKSRNICGICGIDTRKLAKIIREQGVMNGTICDTKTPDMTDVLNYKVKDVVSLVSSKEPAVVRAEGTEKYRVALIDYGAKKGIVDNLVKRGCTVYTFPHNTPSEQVLGCDPDGIMLSNGPGDPADNTYEIEQIKNMLGKKPLFGICLGHQLTALALGGKTVKLKYGHHGVNQPVTDLSEKKTYITSQNHNYAVVADSLNGTGKEIFRNANDQSCEGMSYDGLSAFTVQFHPEANGGPHDTEFLFDRFLKMMEENKNA
ncbi:MAG: glutamine-hydrolyzing carbamoyl-phosphate synthase small subunit [Clostridia bacterium]|nr:glutamine-hydrolyzing carbamoyl-phosphate synthase small subunit [Clostridia bacterium]